MEESLNRIKKPRGVRRDRHCDRCRAKGTKCDLNRPTCRACKISGASCRYPHRVKWMTGANNGDDKPISATETDKAQKTCTESATSGDQKTTINLYGFIDLLAQFYQEIQSSKPDLPNETVQLISRTLRFAQSRLKGSDRRSIQSHLMALGNLSKVIESGHPIALFGIATFAIFEVCCGSFGQWHRHLHGARSLLDLHCHSREDIDRLASQMPGLTDVLAYLLWFDVTGALVRESDLIFDDWHREIMSSQFLDSVGCPPDTFQLLARLSRHNTPLDILDMNSRAMEQILSLESTDTSDRGLTAQIYRYTSAMGTLRKFALNLDPGAGSSHHDKVLSSLADRICDAISKIPPSSCFYVHLGTPAYLTGMYASKAQHCDILRAYWRNCQNGEFPRYPDAQEQCEVRWRSKSIV